VFTTLVDSLNGYIIASFRAYFNEVIGFDNDAVVFDYNDGMSLGVGGILF
jgi:hypothetical protein